VRHRVYGKHLGRNSNQRNALFKGLVRSLILHESITTTEAKAKAVKGLVDKIVVKGKANNNQAKSFIQGFLPDAVASKKLLEEIAPRFSTRTSGFTSLVKLGRRLGDGAMIVKMSFMEGEEKIKTSASVKTSAGKQNSKATRSVVLSEEKDPKSKRKRSAAKKKTKEKSK